MEVHGHHPHKHRRQVKTRLRVVSDSMQKAKGIMNRQSNRHLPLNPTEQVIGSWGLGKWIGASLIEYWNVLIRLLDVCLVTKVRL